MVEAISKREAIINILKENPQGLTIQELSVKSNLSRTTTTRVLEGLKGSQEILQRFIGSAKLNYFKEMKENVL